MLPPRPRQPPLTHCRTGPMPARTSKGEQITGSCPPGRMRGAALFVEPRNRRCGVLLRQGACWPAAGSQRSARQTPGLLRLDRAFTLRDEAVVQSALPLITDPWSDNSAGNGPSNAAVGIPVRTHLAEVRTSHGFARSASGTSDHWRCASSRRESRHSSPSRSASRATGRTSACPAR